MLSTNRPGVHTERGGEGATLFGVRHEFAYRLHHGVAGDDDSLIPDPFGQQIRTARLRGREQEIGEVVRDDPVVLLGHSPVIAAETGFDVHDRYFTGICGERRRQDGVGVALDNHGCRPHLLEDPVECGHGEADLTPAGFAADLEEYLGLRQIELLEERVGQTRVIVLAGVHNDAVVAEDSRDVRQFDDLRPGAENHHDRSVRISALQLCRSSVGTLRPSCYGFSQRRRR